MGAFAGLLKSAGFIVRGSDENIYSPMKEKLAELQIDVSTPYCASNLDWEPDLIVIGNVIRKQNPEAIAAVSSDIPYCSFPEALGELFLSKNRSIVVSGTHGKTTCCALLSHTLESAGIDSGFLFGGIPNDFSESFKSSKEAGSYFVVEGDEYDTAFFDKGPKFLHYQPKLLMCTSLEYDHADIYDDVNQIIARFSQLMELLDKNGKLVLFANSKHLNTALSNAKLQGQVITYGPGGEYAAKEINYDFEGTSFDVVRRNETLGRITSRLSGEHNVNNALGCYIILREAGLDHDQIQAGFASFSGVKRRMEVRGQIGELIVIDDFAHHPTAVKTTLEGARKKFGTRPIWALFEPRSATSCRNIFEDAYAQSFDCADRVLIAPLGRNLDQTMSMDIQRLAQRISAKGVSAHSCGDLQEMIETVRKEAPKDSVILCMSNGAFGNIHTRIIDTLKGH